MAASQESLLTRLDEQTLVEVASGGWRYNVRPETRIASLENIQRAVQNPKDRFYIEDSMPADYWERLAAERRRYPEATDVELVENYFQKKIDQLR